MKTFNLLLILIVISSTHLCSQDKTADKVDYYISKTVKGNLEEVTARVKSELKKQEFGVLTEINMHEKLAEKLEGIEVNPYKILGACNPEFACQTLQAEENIGLFLPCKFIVKQINEHEVEVVALNPKVLMQMLGNGELMDIANEVTDRFIVVLENL